MARLWLKFAKMFGTGWSTQYGAADDGTWGKALAFVTNEAMGKAVDRITREGGRFPPSLPEFAALCAKSMGLPDPVSAYFDACHSRWTHDTVYETARRVGVFELKNRSEKEMLPRFREAFGTVCAEWMAGNKFSVPVIGRIEKQQPAPCSPAIAMSAMAEARAALGV